ncbi:MAG: hypothetical protein IV093_03565 [Rubrivivax sp.]|nr:hypothetical protein [Rubrivivax sp.]
MAVSEDSPKKRGRPAGSGTTRSRPALMFHAWRVVREEIAYRGASGVLSACRAIIERHQLRTPDGRWTRERGITIADSQGTVLARLTDPETLRQWYVSAEKARSSSAEFGAWCSRWEMQAPARFASRAGALAAGFVLKSHVRSGRGGLVESNDECNAAAIKAREGAGAMPKPRRNRR